MKNFIKQISIYTALLLLIYTLFYLLARPFIWGYDFSPEKLSTLNFWFSVDCKHSDGIEAYVLTVVLSMMMGSVLLIPYYKKKFSSYFAYLGVAFILFRLFTLPKNFQYAYFFQFVQNHYWVTIFYLMGVFLFVYFVRWIAEKGTEKHKNIVVITFLGISLFIPSLGFNNCDSSYVLAPAYALNNGFDLKSVYMQYDLFLTGIGSVIMYFDLPLDIYSIIVVISFFISFLVLYRFSSRFFNIKNLAFYYILYTLILRYWANLADPIAYFQVSPLRLDFWIVILLLAYRFGARHYSIGITMFLLTVFHRSFNLFYVISYIEFMIFMICCEHIFVSKFDFKKVLNAFKAYLPNLFLVSLGLGVSYFIFGNFIAPAMKIYNEFKIGFLPVGKSSFFWPIILIVGYTSILLVKMKNEISKQYFETAFLIIFLLLGNMFYFLGRSHDNNLLNISISWGLVLFIGLDLFIIKFKNETTSTSWLGYLSKAPILFILAACLYYFLYIQERIEGKINYISKLEISNVNKLESSVLELKKVIKNDKVYFYDYYGFDFYYTYYGKYKPIGYYQPHATWVLKKNTHTFMQNLLLNNYDLITKNKKSASDISNNLKFKNKYSYKNWVIITNNVIPALVSKK